MILSNVEKILTAGRLCASLFFLLNCASFDFLFLYHNKRTKLDLLYLYPLIMHHMYLH